MPEVSPQADFVDIHGASLPIRDYQAARELFLARGWTDGHPVNLPSRVAVARILDRLGWDGGHVIASDGFRSTGIRLSEIVIHGIMAGCRTEHLRVVRAALEAMFMAGFLASSLAGDEPLWPYFVVNGPAVTELGLNYDQYMMGPAAKPNSVISRAISLVLWNVLDLKPSGALHSGFGCPWRNECVLAERPDGPWPELHEERGFRREASTVTAFLVAEYESILVHLLDTPEHILGTIVDSLSNGRFAFGPHLVILPPNMVAVFHEADWTKVHVIDYICKHTQRSIGGLKRRSRWSEPLFGSSGLGMRSTAVEPGDDEKMVHLFLRQSEYADVASPLALLQTRDAAVFIINAGGDSGPVARLLSPATFSYGGPETVRIRPPEVES